MSTFTIKNTGTGIIESLINNFAINNIYNANKLQGVDINSDTDTVQDSSILVYDNTNMQWTYDILNTNTNLQSVNNLNYQLQQQKIVSSDIQAGDNFGYSVAINSTGDYAIVGAPEEDTGGAAYVFTRSGTTWNEQQKIQSSDVQITERFGNSVAINSTGDYIIVGAERKDSAAGAAYIFTRNGTTWTEQQKIQSSDIQTGDRFGWSTAINSTGDYVIVGAPEEDTGGSNAGAAYVFTRSGTTWTQQQKIQSGDIQAGGNFGNSVAINSTSDYVIVGAYSEDASAGAAYVFTRSGTTWTQQQQIQSSDIQAGDVFGISVSINSTGDYVIVGAYQEDTGGSNAGAAYVFTRDGTTWTQQQKIQSSDIEAGDRFGISVTINSTGDYAIVGAIFEDTGGSDVGAAYIFTRSGTTWTQQQKIVSSDIQAGDWFGFSVSTNSTGDYVIVSARNEDTGGIDAGAAYIFKSEIQLIKIQNEYVDSTTDETINLSGINNILIKTGVPAPTVPAEYEITLANDLVTGKEVIFINDSGGDIKVTFSPSVTGWANSTALAVNGKIKILYTSTTNKWYNIS